MEMKKIKNFQHAEKHSFSSKIIGRGAEAILVHKDGELIKRRIKKGYRYEKLDIKLRRLRTRSEAKIMAKASSKIKIPEIIGADDKKCEIKMDFVDGMVLSNSLDDIPEKKAINICKKIGENIAAIHDMDIIHGDLTTSNMILNENDKVYFIDFGLGFHSKRIEDKAVDLHLLRQAFESKHFLHWREYFESALKGYKKSQNSEKVIEQLKKVESRGRYKGKH